MSKDKKSNDETREGWPMNESDEPWPH